MRSKAENVIDGHFNGKAWVSHSSAMRLQTFIRKRKTLFCADFCDNFFIVQGKFSISIRNARLLQSGVWLWNTKKLFRRDGSGELRRRREKILKLVSRVRCTSEKMLYIFFPLSTRHHKFFTYFLINTSLLCCCFRFFVVIVIVIVWIPCSSCALFKYLDIHCLFSSLITHFIPFTFIRITCSTSLERSTVVAFARHKFYVCCRCSDTQTREWRFSYEWKTDRKTGFKDCELWKSIEKLILSLVRVQRVGVDDCVDCT